MAFQFGQVYYAIVSPEGRVLSPFESQHNGLYESKKVAERYLKKQLDQAISNAQHYEGREVMSEWDIKNRDGWKERIKEYEAHEIVPVEVKRVG